MSVSTSSRSPSATFGSGYDSGMSSPCSSSMPTLYSGGRSTPSNSTALASHSSPAMADVSQMMEAGRDWNASGSSDYSGQTFSYNAFYTSGSTIAQSELKARAASFGQSQWIQNGYHCNPAEVQAFQSSDFPSMSASYPYNTAPTTIAPQLLQIDSGIPTPPETSASAKASTPGSEEDARTQRRQGVTCDHCRSKHIRCVPARQLQKDDKCNNDAVPTRCQRCTDKNLDCTRTYRPPSRRYPRPSRTGKRIEQARILHGSVNGQPGSFAESVATGPRAIFEQLLQPSVPHQANMRLHNDILAGSTSLRLLTCFFATAHMQMPIVDFHNFSARYNFARGDFRIMSTMAQGGDPAQGIPAARQSAPGLVATSLPLGVPSTKSDAHSTLSTPGTTEALVAAMHAWAALYTDMPIAFGAHAGALSSQIPATNELESCLPSQSADVGEQGASSSLAKGRRPKRKQGVACDTCRLRRLRCDKLERPEGMGCSRCEDKRIVCTDEYIQKKRRKVLEQEARCKSVDENFSKTRTPSPLESAGTFEDEGVIGSCSTHARDVARGSGPASWNASEEQTKWIDSGPTLPDNYVFGQSRRMLAYGIARQPFFRQLLQRALHLIYEHKLLEQPSIEAIQAMSILIQVLDMVTPGATHNNHDNEAYRLAAACNRHAKILGLQSSDEVDEQDRHAVEQLLSAMQRKRLWCCVWTRDALVSGLFRREPAFTAERALGIRRGKVRPEVDAAHNNQDQDASSLQGLHSDSLASHGPSPELNGEMGLSFSILAVMQIGALSRFAGKHLDNIQAPSELGSLAAEQQDAFAPLPPPAMRFPLIPSRVEVRKLLRACHALWSSIDALLSFFDKCALAAQHQMDSLHPFQPLGWIATVKVAAAMLDLCAFRILTERVQLAQTYLLALGASASHSTSKDGTAAPLVPTEEDYQRLAELRSLQQTSQKRTFLSCRRIVMLVEHLLSKQVFQTGGLIMRHIVLIAQYLARSPSILPQHPEMKEQQQSYSVTSHLEEAGAKDEAESVASSIDPRKLSSGYGAFGGVTDAPTTQQLDRRSSRGMSDALSSTTDLAPFDEQRKRYEVSVCLEAVAQLGYAWPGMDAEITHVEELMQGGSSASAGSNASSGSL